MGTKNSKKTVFPIPHQALTKKNNANFRLTEKVEGILRLMIAKSPAKSGSPFQEARSVVSPAFFFPRDAPIANFGVPGEQEYRFAGEKAIYLRLFPKYSDGQPELLRASLKALFLDRRIVNPMSWALGGSAASNDYGWVTIDPSSNPLRSSPGSAGGP